MTDRDVDVGKPAGRRGDRERQLAVADVDPRMCNRELFEQAQAVNAGRDADEADSIAPSALRDSDSAVCEASAAAATASRAFSYSSLPAAVGVTPRAWRSSSLTPTSVSSCAIACDRAGCAIFNRRAARVIWPSSTTVTK